MQKDRSNTSLPNGLSVYWTVAFTNSEQAFKLSELLGCALALKPRIVAVVRHLAFPVLGLAGKVRVIIAPLVREFRHRFAKFIKPSPRQRGNEDSLGACPVMSILL